MKYFNYKEETHIELYAINVTIKRNESTMIPPEKLKTHINDQQNTTLGIPVHF